MFLFISFSVASQALRLLYDCPVASNYLKISNIKHTKSKILNTPGLGMQLSLRNIFKPSVKVAVSYRFSQGLLTLMCNNSELKADINFFFFLLCRQTS